MLFVRPLGAVRKSWIEILTIAALMLLAPIWTRAQSVQILVPAYFYPGGSELEGWRQLTASATQVALNVIFNPATGPGTSADPNYTKVVSTLKSAGAKMFAYINVDYGKRALTEMQQDVDTYLKLYPDLENGFFLDLVPTDNDTAHKATCAALYRYIKKKNRGYRVIGNPGTKIPESYLTLPAADTMVTFEGYTSDYPAYVPDAYTTKYASSSFSHLIHDEPTEAGMRNALKRAIARKAGYIYITDVVQTDVHSNAYDRLPSYWNAEVAAVRVLATPKTRRRP